MLLLKHLLKLLIFSALMFVCFIGERFHVQLKIILWIIGLQDMAWFDSLAIGKLFPLVFISWSGGFTTKNYVMNSWRYWDSSVKLLTLVTLLGVINLRMASILARSILSSHPQTIHPKYTKNCSQIDFLNVVRSLCFFSVSNNYINSRISSSQVEMKTIILTN